MEQKRTTPLQDVILKLLKRFPNAGSWTLARIAMKEAPDLCLSLERVHRMIRYYRGASGQKQRRRVERLHPGGIRPLRSSGNPFGRLPQPKQHFAQPWEALQIDGPLRALVLSDVHIPYHDPEALLSSLKYGLDRKADTVLLNGDTADFFGVSQWQKDPRQRDLTGEIKAVREFLGIVREGFPKARIIFKHGNHEERWERYLFAKAPEVVGVEDFELGQILRFAELRIEEVRDMRPIRLGKLNVIHGHEYRFAIQSPVNPARGFYLRAKTHVLGGHLHQTSQHSEKDLEGKVISAWSTGCLSDLHPDYRPLNNWSAGFAFVEVDKEGKFQVSNPRIIDGKIYE